MSKLQKKAFRNFILCIIAIGICISAIFSSIIRMGIFFSSMGVLVYYISKGLWYVFKGLFASGLFHWRLKGILNEEEYEAFSNFEYWSLSSAIRMSDDIVLSEEVMEKVKSVKIPKGYEPFW